MAQIRKIILKWLLPSAKLGFKLLAVSAEVFCRHSFGLRYGLWLAGSFALCAGYTCFVVMVFPGAKPDFLVIYVWILSLLVLFHVAGLCLQRPPLPPSYSTGQSWHFWQRIGFSQFTMHIVIEPGLHVVAGVIIFPVDRFLSVWLHAAGVCLFVKEIIVWWNDYEQLLDALDSRAEGERISRAVRQYTAPQSGREQPVTPVTPAQVSPQQIVPLAPNVRSLDPALRRMLSSETGESPPGPIPSVPGNFSDGPLPPA